MPSPGIRGLQAGTSRSYKPSFARSKRTYTDGIKQNGFEAGLIQTLKTERLLDLTRDEADTLFYDRNTLEELEGIVDDIAASHYR